MVTFNIRDTKASVSLFGHYGDQTWVVISVRDIVGDKKSGWQKNSWFLGTSTCCPLFVHFFPPSGIDIICVWYYGLLIYIPVVSNLYYKYSSNLMANTLLHRVLHENTMCSYSDSSVL